MRTHLDPSLEVRPHAQHLDHSFLLKNLIDEPVLDVDAPRVRAGKIANKIRSQFHDEPDRPAVYLGNTAGRVKTQSLSCTGVWQDVHDSAPLSKGFCSMPSQRPQPQP